MGLQTPFGVVSGSVNHADLVNPSGGSWPHYHVWLNTPGGVYDSAINLGNDGGVLGLTMAKGRWA